MKRSLTLSAIALAALMLAGCNQGPTEEELHQQMLDAGKQEAVDGCTKAVKDQAKYSTAAELQTPIYGELEPAEDGQGPAGTAYYSVSFGDATFVNGFNVPVDYEYGCVTYHDENGKLLRTRAEARKEGILSSYSYAPSTDSLR